MRFTRSIQIYKAQRYYANMPYSCIVNYDYELELFRQLYLKESMMCFLHLCKKYPEILKDHYPFEMDIDLWMVYAS